MWYMNIFTFPYKIVPCSWTCCFILKLLWGSTSSSCDFYAYFMLFLLMKIYKNSVNHLQYKITIEIIKYGRIEVKTCSIMFLYNILVKTLVHFHDWWYETQCAHFCIYLFLVQNWDYLAETWTKMKLDIQIKILNVLLGFS